MAAAIESSELVKTIDEYVAHLNKEPKPFIWTKSARDILQKVIRANSRLSSKQNATLHQMRAPVRGVPRTAPRKGAVASPGREPA